MNSSQTPSFLSDDSALHVAVSFLPQRTAREEHRLLEGLGGCTEGVLITYQDVSTAEITYSRASNALRKIIPMSSASGGSTVSHLASEEVISVFSLHPVGSQVGCETRQTAEQENSSGATFSDETSRTPFKNSINCPVYV